MESGLRPLIVYRSHEYLLRRRRSFFSDQQSAISDQLLFAAEFLMAGYRPMMPKKLIADR